MEAAVIVALWLMRAGGPPVEPPHWWVAAAVIAYVALQVGYALRRSHEHRGG